MKKIILLSLLFTSLVLYSQNKVNTKALNANNIHIGIQNIGNLNTKIGDGSGGGYWMILTPDSTIVFDQGPWIIGKINNKIHLSLSQWGTNYSPGPIINNKAAMQFKPEDSLKYRIYKISKGDNNTNKDYLEWPYEFGAPKAKDGKPRIYQDQTLWTVFNSYDPKSVYKNYWIDSLFIMPIEIQQLSFSKKGNSKDEIDLFSNTVFFEWTIINKGTQPIDSAYFSFWADIDFSNPLENFIASDSFINTCYLWTNKTNTQPAVGYTMLYGPASAAIGKNGVFKGVRKKDIENRNIVSTHSFIDDVFDKNSLVSRIGSRQQAWNLARGLNIDGTKKIDPTTGQLTTYSFNGDPVTDKGWIWKERTGGGAGFNLFSGPFNLAPNDTQWVMMALVPALGKDYKESITIMRNKVKLLRSMPYDSIAFCRNAVKVGIKQEREIPNQFVLNQNYPNPFNPETIIRFQISENSHVSLKIYDVIGREVATLVNEIKQAGKHQAEFSIANSQLSSGVYFYTLTTPKAAITKKMLLVK